MAHPESTEHSQDQGDTVDHGVEAAPDFDQLSASLTAVLEDVYQTAEAFVAAGHEADVNAGMTPDEFRESAQKYRQLERQANENGDTAAAQGAAWSAEKRERWAAFFEAYDAQGM